MPNSLQCPWFRPPLGLNLNKDALCPVRNLIRRHDYEISVCLIAINELSDENKPLG